MINNNIQTGCIILCAGKGTRMQSKDTHKVCFPIDGKPAILHSMDRYKAAGINRYTIVVGSMAEQVMHTISSAYDGVNYAYQKEALGTGNAARIGFDAMEAYGTTGPVLITMGDKIIEPDVIERLISEFVNKNLDLCFVVGPKEYNASGGHIVLNNGKVRGIVESLDIKKAELYKKILSQLQNGSYKDRDPRKDIEDISKNIISSERKREKVVLQMEGIMEYIRNGETDKATELLRKNSVITLGNDEFEPEVLDKAKYVNSAIYMFKPEAFRFGLSKMTTDNADKEEYLTEAINFICNTEGYKSSIVIVKERESILTYNNVVELLRVKEILTGAKDQCKLSFTEYKPVNEWIDLFNVMPQSLLDALVDIYGEHNDIIEERRKEYLKVLEHFKNKYGADRKAVITRAPGRVNLMGRHVEHRGGNVNVISVDKEVICVASPNSEEVNISNTCPDFKDRTFSIEEHFKNVNWDNWLRFLESKEISQLVMLNQGDWLNYVKAPIIRLQYLYKDRPLTGMDMAFNGNIPVAAGLSSSSAIVVATAEAAVAINNLDVTPQQFVDLCGEGEWFVGSRGGAGDHAAMKFAQRGYIASLGFFPFGYRGAVEFPKGYKLLVANSFMKANKTTNAKDLFNQRVASYEFGFMMIKDRFPTLKEKLKYLRDLNPETLGVTPSYIYSMLLAIPEKVSADNLFKEISSEYHQDIKRIMATHKTPKEYEIRTVIMYGIAECRRSFLCAKLLEQGDFEGFGRMMNISHDGDRIVMFDEKGVMHKFDYDLSDKVLQSLIDDLKSENVERVARAQLENQPGGYACSTPEIDFIVDTAKRIDGVLGAQLSGAGLGGCVMILAQDEAVPRVINELKTKYYDPRGFENGITVSIPVKGSRLVRV